MIQFVYNNITYNIANRATIKDRLKQRELLKLPLEGWKELLTLVNGKYDIESLMYLAKIGEMEKDVTDKYKELYKEAEDAKEKYAIPSAFAAYAKYMNIFLGNEKNI